METDCPRALHWEGSSKKDFKTFPVAVQKSMGMQLYVIQSGRWPVTTQTGAPDDPIKHEHPQRLIRPGF